MCMNLPDNNSSWSLTGLQSDAMIAVWPLPLAQIHGPCAEVESK